MAQGGVMRRSTAGKQIVAALLAIAWTRAARADTPPSEPRASQEKPYAALSGFMLRPWAAALSMGGGAFWPKDVASEREGVGAGLGMSLYGRAAFLYVLFVDAGFTAGSASDQATFRETTCDYFSGEDCSSSKSGVSAGTLSTKVGLIGRFFFPMAGETWQVAALGAIGHRGVYLERSIDGCKDCTTHDLKIDGGAFLSPELDLSYASNGQGASRLGGAIGLKLEYERYLRGDIASAFWASIFIEVL
jgi:hypothetical protein